MAKAHSATAALAVTAAAVVVAAAAAAASAAAASAAVARTAKARPLPSGHYPCLLAQVRDPDTYHFTHIPHPRASSPHALFSSRPDVVSTPLFPLPFPSSTPLPSPPLPSPPLPSPLLPSFRCPPSHSPPILLSDVGYAGGFELRRLEQVFGVMQSNYTGRTRGEGGTRAGARAGGDGKGEREWGRGNGREARRGGGRGREGGGKGGAGCMPVLTPDDIRLPHVRDSAHTPYRFPNATTFPPLLPPLPLQMWAAVCMPVFTPDDIRLPHVRDFTRPLFSLRPDVAFALLKTTFACDVRAVLSEMEVSPSFRPDLAFAPLKTTFVCDVLEVLSEVRGMDAEGCRGVCMVQPPLPGLTLNQEIRPPSAQM
ncbi:unnamed protein product [Closterium sp. Naga37s-1]|nr:unnamed protein product [Closterium sp. Naga37s-1]